MIKHQINLTIRNLFQQRKYYLIQIFGLSIALTCVIIILSWVRYEKGFDGFHKHSDQLYRMLMTINKGSENQFGLAVTPPPLANAAHNKFPEVVNATRFEFSPQVVFNYNGKINNEGNGALADPAFLEMFSFPLLSGNKNVALSDPQSVVLTKSLAVKYFGEEDPMNKLVEIEGDPFKVTAILKDIPANSHLQFDFLLPIQIKELMGSDLSNWGNVNLNSYIQVAEHTDFNTFNAKIKDWKTPRQHDQFYLQPVLDIHKTSGIEAEESVIMDGKYVNLFIALAFVILMIACINFINLQSGQVLKRSKEVGIRKVNGANKIQLIFLFMSESCIVLLISYLLSFLIVEFTFPYFIQLFNYQIILHFYDTEFLAFLALLYIILLFITSTAPAFRFASFHSTDLMRKLPLRGKKGVMSRQALVITQFVFTVFFITGTIVINKQFNFIKNSSINQQNDQIIYLPFKGEIGSKYESFKNRLLAKSSISYVTAKNSLPTQVADKTGDLHWAGKDPNLSFVIEATGVDFQYFETLGIDVLDGRTFSEAFTSDGKFALILNETAMKSMNLKDPVGADLSLWGYPGRIVGVVEDVNTKSLKNNIDGQVFYVIPDYEDNEISSYGVILIKIEEDIPNTLASIEQDWAELNPGIPFDYHFLDEAVEALYRDELRLSKLMNYASILSIVICCLGLLGLVIHNSSSRTKEIGIRKINGATIRNIMMMLNKNYVQWVCYSFVIAFPLAWFILDNWLRGFSEQIELSWWIFGLAGTVTLFIALITINGQILNVARKNPADVIRYE